MKARVKEAQTKNKGRFDWTHRLRPMKIEEGDWMLVYNKSLDKQCRPMQKFVSRWFGPSVVTSTNNNLTYHLVKLDKTMIVVPVAGKWIKVFTKRYKPEPNLDLEEDADRDEDLDEDLVDDGVEENT